MTTTPRQLQELYQQGINISQFLREEKGITYNTQEIIEITYDLQSGSYISALEDEKVNRHYKSVSQEIANIISSLCQPNSILEAGVGEATVLSGVLQNLTPVSSYGFDLSWSRIAFAKKWLHRQGITTAILCSGDLFNIPFLDNSIDVVYTCHAIEPNRGGEASILRELYRVARRYIILLEPAYEFASPEAKQRMDFHSYCKNLKDIALSINLNVIEHKLFPFSYNPLNPTALMIIRKEGFLEEDTRLLTKQNSDSVFACPKFKTPLKKVGGMLFSREGLVVYPIIGNIPCLRVENGIFASKYEDIISRIEEAG